MHQRLLTYVPKLQVVNTGKPQQRLITLYFPAVYTSPGACPLVAGIPARTDLCLTPDLFVKESLNTLLRDVEVLAVIANLNIT